MRLYNLVDKKVLRKQLEESGIERTTFSFYQYANITDPHKFRDEFYLSLQDLGVFGRIYVASEGINGQASIPAQNFEKLRAYLNTIPFLKGIRLNVAVDDDGRSFYKLIIKVRPKILADGLNDDTFDVTDRGVHLDAEGFNQLADDPNTIIIDMRNHYESEVGHMEGAITPEVETFRESLPIIEEMLEQNKDKNLVMYCTGGIRCEKASAYFKHKGFKNVFQLNGGIINYVNEVKEKGLDNKFIGKNFVFDDRLGERVTDDIIAECHQCGKPCDTHINCGNDACHLLFIQCDKCATKLDHCCSKKCQDFSKLPDEERKERRKTEEFNGTKFSKNKFSMNLLRLEGDVEYEE